jgi:hypothetical protein
MQFPADRVESNLAGPARLAPSLMRVAEALGWPLVLVDAQGRLQHANRPALRLMADEGNTAAWCWPGRPGGSVGRLRPLSDTAPGGLEPTEASPLPGLWLLDLRSMAPPPFGK